jgi:hypothetical protein
MCIPPIAVSCAATDDIPTAIAQATIKETAIEQRSTLATTSSLRKKNVTASMRVWAHAAKEWKQMVGLDSENRHARRAVGRHQRSRKCAAAVRRQRILGGESTAGLHRETRRKNIGQQS